MDANLKRGGGGNYASPSAPMGGASLLGASKHQHLPAIGGVTKKEPYVNTFQ